MLRHIDVEKLCKRNFQMNLEFIQWMKILHDTMVDPGDTTYNAEERLRAAGVKPIEATKIGVGATSGGAKRAPAPSVAKKENVQPARAAASAAPAKAAADASSGKLQQAQLEITDLKLTVDGLEKVCARKAPRLPAGRGRKRSPAAALVLCRAPYRRAGARLLLWQAARHRNPLPDARGPEPALLAERALDPLPN